MPDAGEIAVEEITGRAYGVWERDHRPCRVLKTPWWLDNGMIHSHVIVGSRA